MTHHVGQLSWMFIRVNVNVGEVTTGGTLVHTQWHFTCAAWAYISRRFWLLLEVVPNHLGQPSVHFLICGACILVLQYMDTFASTVTPGRMREERPWLLRAESPALILTDISPG